MSALVRIFGGLVQTVVSIAVLTLLGIIAFFVTVFVVSTGAGLAGYDPSGDFVVLSAALLVIAGLLGGIPFGGERPTEATDDGHHAGFE